MEALLLRLLRLTAMLMMIMAVANAEQAQNKSIHDILKEKGLPAGLVPKCVSNYSFSPENGLLQVNLHKPCFAKFEAIETVYFDKTIEGNLSFGQLAGVNGVEQQELFLWFPVKDIRVDIPNSGFIYFDVGVVYKQVSLSLFESPPDCDTTPPASHSFISLPEYASQGIHEWF